VQVLDVFQERHIVRRYQRGLFTLVSFFLIALLPGIILAGEDNRIDCPSNVASNTAITVQIFSAIIVILAFISIKRRPDVFTPEGKLVDRQNQSSLLTKCSLSWGLEILRRSAKEPIEISDLPAMGSHLRAKDVKKYFQSITINSKEPLWLQISRVFRPQLIIQLCLCIVSVVADAIPQILLLQLLRYLEAREVSGVTDPKAQGIAGMIFLTTVCEITVDYSISWRMWSKLGFPIGAALIALIFEKMTRVKDCKSAQKTQRERDGYKEKAAQSEDITNMFTVDINRVQVFGAISQHYLLYTLRIIVSIFFLWNLFGWESLLAGIFSLALIFPLNKFLASRYRASEKKLMVARDEKMKVVSEVLQGIRQIKFWATEPKWTDKINKARDEELAQLWQANLNNLYTVLAAKAGVVLLNVVTLTIYTYRNGALRPSLAFTGLKVLMQLGNVLGKVPWLQAQTIKATVSCDRIDAFLKSDEKPENTLPGNSITFDKASVSFPSKTIEDNQVDEDIQSLRGALGNRFVLRNLNLQFPNRQLTVVMGPSGAGKSLLLAAILGEADVLEGTITVPRAIGQRFDSKATAANWIISDSIAFVAQTPWIENKSIRDTILFGLPYDETRYNKVLEACAFRDDLVLFDDGDLTEIGAKGIRLSGGQKVRLTLARALYSRAGILILDDIFSALDVKVGKHIYDCALTGELAEGRTRIVATHYASLCLSRAKYVVHVSANGVLEHAGLVEGFRQASRWENILMVRANNFFEFGCWYTLIV
jgi:ABC-type multidrug transport system fused ATPase/permease subunit